MPAVQPFGAQALIRSATANSRCSPARVRLITSEDRVTGFRQAVHDAGLELPEENLIEAQFTRDGGYVAMTELLDREIEVEAVLRGQRCDGRRRYCGPA